MMGGTALGKVPTGLKRLGCFVLLLQCCALLGSFAAQAKDDQVTQILAAAQSLYAQHKYSSALQAAEKAERVTAKLLDQNDPRRAASLVLLADAMRATGQILQAEPVYKQAIQATKALGNNSEEQLLEAFSKLGLLYMDAGYEYRAGTILRKARYWAEKLYGPEHPKLAEAYDRWAEVQLARLDFTRADESVLAALNIRRKLFRQDHPARIRSSIDLAIVRLFRPSSNMLGYFKPPAKGSKDLLDEALGFLEKDPHRDPVQYFRAVSAIGDYYRVIGNHEESFKHKQQALRLVHALYGPRHPKYAEGLIALADVKVKLKQVGEAARNYEDALRILRDCLYDGHPVVKTAMTKLRYLYRDIGEQEKSAAWAAQLENLPVLHYADFKLAYATTRDWNEKKKAYDRLGKTNELSYGTATVQADANALFERIDRYVESRGVIDKSTEPLSYSKNFKLLDMAPGGVDKIGIYIQKATRKSIRFPKQAMLFVHGYNVTHEQAVKRAAQIAYDLEFDGALLLFSWNSAGSHVWYMGDRGRAEAAAEPLIKFLDYLSIMVPQIKIHIVAHSMGNRVLSRAVEKLAKRSARARMPILGEIIMAHSDIDLDWCRKMGQAKRFSRGVTNYVNASDWALWVSSTIRMGEGRCGRVAQSYPGVETIDTTGMGGRTDETVLGLDTQNHHGVFVNDPILFGDMYRLLSVGRRPVDERTPEFRPVSPSESETHWAFEKNINLAGEVPK